MLSRISILLTNHHLTLSEISKSNHISEQELRLAINQKPDDWSARTLLALANSLKIKPGELLELLAPTYKLMIDDDNQLLQGIYIEDPEMYEQVRFVVESEHLEGWEPEEKDILALVDEAINPSPKIQKEISKVWGEKNE